MAKHRAHVPKHRDADASAGARARRASRTAIRNTAVLGALSATATGTVVTGGVLLGQTASAQPSAYAASAPIAHTEAALRAARQAAFAGSRADHRAATDPAKAAALSVPTGRAESRTEDLSDADPRVIARALLPEYGYGEDQWSCLDSLYVSESGWQVDADNPTSTAYGIPQALTGLHDLPPGYLTSAEVQIRWGFEYIRSSYGTPCGAWAFKRENNWY